MMTSAMTKLKTSPQKQERGFKGSLFIKDLSKMLFSIVAMLKRDLVVAYRQRINYLNPLMFFVLITMLFPLAVTAEPARLLQIGPGIIWISLLFSSLLSIENLFSLDYEDGTLEQVLITSECLSLYLLIKSIIHWLYTTGPLLLISIVIANLFFIPKQGIIILFLSLLLGSPVLVIIGGIGSALTLGLGNRGIVLMLMMLPLYLPVLIFGSAAVNSACQNLSVISQMAWLAAMLTLSLTLAPLAMAAALKISLE
jgi:heme exporter protein B